MNLLETSVQKVPLCRWVWLFNCAVLTGVCFIEGGMFFIETPPSSRRYVYLGGYVLEKLQRSGGGTFIWGGTSIWHRIVLLTLIMLPLIMAIVIFWNRFALALLFPD